ncbi:ABC transporter ATP-binding protein [Brevibacterium yomogidense]|uniref:Duplicated ATPase component CbrU of energizing module of predicted cobalamin ECF transporter n=1 Tax=Brevibacterium yomogidense TaxID=946573 RepID=A0A1X6XLD4_9MICO|nr:ATP-binding cassette domain-containing protein [Brevibacterium yomogidense]SLM99943.1 Duplicated ATPase component CbrU of energizing module of predicted cobalamin ECF transporter [Brevibacterium yomogidense]
MPASPVISLENVSFRYPGTAEDTLRNVTLQIAEGDFAAVVGGNGSAKTTLCKTFNGLVPHYWSGEFSGVAEVCGIDTYTSSVAQLSSQVGYVYQDFANQLVRPTVRDEIAFAPVNFGHVDHAERTREALEMLRITDLSERFVWQLSGGQAHLTALASVLALRPRVVVVDEPVAELDPARAQEIYQRLEVLNEQFGLTIVTIEHHAEFIARFAKSVVLMADGAPVWHLPVQDAVNRSHELAEHGIPAPQIVQAAHRLGLADAPRTVPEAARALRAHAPVAATASGTASGAVAGTRSGAGPRPSLEQFTRPAAEQASAPLPVVARATAVQHGYRTVHGRLHNVLDELDVDLRRGDRVALVGGNGSGKTTLLKLLAGILVPRSGDVEVSGTNTRKKSAGQLADHVAYLWQQPQQMFLKESIRSDIALFPRERGVPGWEAIVDDTLSQVRLDDFADRDGRSLSGGQQRRATLAIGLAMRPDVLLLDEPTASLDIASRDAVVRMLDQLSGTIACSVVATHDMTLVSEWANRVLVMEGGRVASDLSPHELFDQPDLLTRANLVPPQITQLGMSLGMTPPPLDVREFVDRFDGLKLQHADLHPASADLHPASSAEMRAYGTQDA